MDEVHSNSSNSPRPAAEPLPTPPRPKKTHKRRSRQSAPLQPPPGSPPTSSAVNLTGTVAPPTGPPIVVGDSYHTRTSYEDDAQPPTRTRRHKQRVTYDPALDASVGHTGRHTGAHSSKGSPPQYEEEGYDRPPGAAIDVNDGMHMPDGGVSANALVRGGMGGSEDEDDRGASSSRPRGAAEVDDGKPQEHDEFLEKLRESMIRRGIADEHSAAVTGRNEGNQLTLDEIRRGLGAFGKLGGESHMSPSKVAGRPSSGENLTLSDGDNDADEFEPLDNDELNQCKARMQALSQLCEEVLVYCSLLDSSRLRAVEEGTRLQKSLRLLEALIEAAPQREILYQVERLRHINTKLDQRYRGLKVKAKQLLRECQESRDRLEAEYQKANANVQTLESELFSLQTASNHQRKELERAREASLSLKSPRDVADLDLKLQCLEKDNEELRFQKAQVEEEFDKLSQVLASQADSSGSQFGPSSDSIRMKSEIALLEGTLKTKLEDIRARDNDYAKKLSSLRQDVDNYATYGKRLLRMVDNVSENKEN